MLNLTTNSKFLGKMYYFISIPVKTDSGALIGYHISGIPSQKIYNAIQSQLRLPYMLLGLLIVTIIVPMLFSYSFTKSVIINRIKNVQDKLEIMSKGDFTVKLKPKYNDEIGELAYSVGAMAKDVSSSLYVINEKLSRLSNVSNELTGLSERVSAGVAQQSAAASSSASAIEELNVTVQEVANNASIVADAANRADKLVVDGHTMSVNSMKLMETIAQNVQQNSLIVNNLGQLSQEIGQIIQVINDIADQTNLLALNAAIEAARAGDHGRGFAVVADEVRKLAEKTTEATKDIVNMISTIQNETQTAVVNMTANAEKANEGMTMAEHTKQALEEILESVKAVTVEVNKIAIATEEEATAMDLLNQSVVEIDSIAKENESIANETIKSISELNDSNSEINKAVSQFKYNK
jgi:methyl-accepting chemotaxis protein